MEQNQVHVVSFVTIMISLLGANYMIVSHETPDTAVQTNQDIMIIDIVAFAGLSFYGFGVSWNASGLQVQTDPNKKG